MKTRLLPMARGLAAATLLLPAAPALQGQESTRVFPSQVELVAVELIVVDGNGRPIPDLGPGDFRVEVKGRARRVVSAEFVPVAQEPDELPPTQGETGYSTNEALRPGRLVLLIVDTSNIEAGRGRDEIGAASRMLDRLGPTDRVGLLTIPGSGPREEFTTDHERVRAALTKVVGQWQLHRRRISLAEALSGGGAADIPSYMDQERWAEATRRECGGDQGCGIELQTEALQIMNEYRDSSAKARAVLTSAFEALRGVEGEKVVILVSQGLGFPEMGGQPGSGGSELRKLVAAAVAAQTAFYMVPVRASAAFIGDIPMRLLDDDRRLHFSGLEMLATDAGAAILPGEPERAFERALRETAGYYRLGFEPEGDDRDGKAHKLRVSVTREGAVVRARPTEILRSIATPSQTKGDLVAALRSPTLATALPLRVATWSLAGTAPGKVQLLIGAEIGGEADPHGLAVGYVLLDAKGKVAASASQPLRDETQAAAGPLPFSASATVVPGAYTLRLAVRDGRGRLGSVEHNVEASLVKAGAFTLSDLLLGRVPQPGQRFRPAVVPEAAGEALLVHGEVYGAEETALDAARATLEVVASETGASVRSIAARVVPASTPGRRVVQAVLPIADLAPGRYLARVVVSDGRMPRGAVVRPFRVVIPSQKIGP
jgi:VWFA-related protein